MEDNLKAKFEKEKKRMLSDFEERLKEAIEKTKKEEEKKKQSALASLQAECDLRYEDLKRQMYTAAENAEARQESLRSEILSLKEQLKQRDEQIRSLTNQVQALETEISSLRKMGDSAEGQAAQLAAQLKAAQETI